MHLAVQGNYGVLGLGADVAVSSIPKELPGLWEVAITQVSHMVKCKNTLSGRPPPHCDNYKGGQA